MLFLTLFLGALLQLVAVAGQYDYGFNIHPLLHARQDSSYLVTTGLADRINGNGTLPVRREIRDLQSDNATWTLYILGLDMMMYMNQTERTSWYQIAGIHGRPFTAWDGVEATAGNENNGYCNHVSILFSPWHRPYLAVYEQVLYDIIQFIATFFPEGPIRTEYTAAATNFRIPYWDWAAAQPAGQNTVPDVVAGSDSIAVDGPNGVQTIHNPLFSYVFKPFVPSDLPDPPMDLWNQTMRWPSAQSADAESQNSQMVTALENSATSLRNRLFNLFTNYANFTEFGTEAYSNTLYYDSLESIHDYIHGYTGNGGHMTYIEYSAFDPIFFLHHAMVDRCFALWQELYPNSWVVPEPSIYGTFTTSTGEIQDETSPLTPFRSDEAGGFWTSDSSRTTSIFGYAYPETTGEGNVTLQVINAINKLYGTTSPSSLTARDHFTVRRSISEKKNRDLAATNSNNLPTSITQGTKYREWITNIRVMKTALQEPFFIQIFLGPYNPDPATWSFEPNLVGTHCIFTRTTTGMSACSDCAAEQLVGGTVPLTSALLADIQNDLLGSLEPAEVVPYLNQHLRYQVSTMNGTAYTDTIDSLSISVVSAEVQKLTNGHLPKWGVLQPEIDNVQCG